MRKNLFKLSFVALALSLLASCGTANDNEEAGKLTNKMSDKVILARTQIDSKGMPIDGKIEKIIVNRSDIKNNADVVKAFNKQDVISPKNMSVLESTTSTNNCLGRRCVAAPVWQDNRYYIGESRCMVSAGCLWFPGKHILGAAGRIIYTIGSGISGLGSGLWNGARGVGLDTCTYGGVTCERMNGVFVRPWTGANFTYREAGCAAVSCSTFYAPSYANTFVQDNYSYTQYHQVSSPYYNETSYEHVDRFNRSSNVGGFVY